MIPAQFIQYLPVNFPAKLEAKLPRDNGIYLTIFISHGNGSLESTTNLEFPLSMGGKQGLELFINLIKSAVEHMAENAESTSDYIIDLVAQETQTDIDTVVDIVSPFLHRDYIYPSGFAMPAGYQVEMLCGAESVKFQRVNLLY